MFTINKHGAQFSQSSRQGFFFFFFYCTCKDGIDETWLFLLRILKERMRWPWRSSVNWAAPDHTCWKREKTQVWSSTHAERASTERSAATVPITQQFQPGKQFDVTPTERSHMHTSDQLLLASLAQSVNPCALGLSLKQRWQQRMHGSHVKRILVLAGDLHIVYGMVY